MNHLLVVLFATFTAAFAGFRDPMPTPDPPVVQADRVEIGVSGRDAWTVEPAGQRGLLLIGTDSRGAAWTIVSYSVDFAEQWVTRWESPRRKAVLVDRVVTDDELVMLLHRPKRNDFSVVVVALDDGTVSEHTLNSPIRLFAMHQLAVVDDDVYGLATVRENRFQLGIEGELLHIDTQSGQVRQVSLSDAIDARRVGFLRMTADPTADALDLSLYTQQRKRRSVHAVTVRDGAVADHRTLAPPKDGTHNLLTAQRVRTTEADLMVGTYARTAKGMAAQGLVVSKLGPDGGEQWRRTTSFSDLDRFFDYLPKRKQARVEKRARRKKDKGADLKLGYLLNLHDVVEQQNNLLVIGEAYYPEYETHQRVVTYTENGVTKTRIETYTVFVGYRYTHAVVVAFDAEGTLKWDASFPIGNILSYSVRDRVRVNVNGDRVTMVYAYGGAIFSKVATATGLEEDEGHQHAEAVGGGTVRRTWATHTEHWYDDRFLVWSYDKVVGGEGGRRKVFAFATVEGD